MNDENYLVDDLGYPIYDENEIGEAPSYEPVNTEFGLRERVLDFDERNAISYRIKQIKDSNGRTYKVAKYNKYKEYITKTLKSGNLKEGSIKEEWFYHRLKFIRFLIRKDIEENGNYETIIDDLIDDMNAVLGGSLSINHIGIDTVLTSKEHRTIDGNLAQENKKPMRLWGNRREREYY